MLRIVKPFLALSALAFLISSTGGASAAVDVFGGWMLNRAASKLTVPPMTAEMVIIVPWGKSGWVWNQISGGAYQPEDLIKGVKPPAEVDGPAADAAIRTSTSTRMMYWASWDSKNFTTYGRDARQVQLKRVNDQSFEATFFKAPQEPAQGDNATLAFSPNGQRLTVTSKDDVRVYDRIDPAKWPSRKIEPAAAASAGGGLLCSGIWNIDEQLTHRTRSPLGPYVQYFGPWGKNGWVRLNTGSMDATGAEVVFNSFNGNAFQVYGGDPREQTARQRDADTFETTAVRYGKPADTTIVQFSKDCKRLTFTVPEGTDRRTGLKYYNDVRVYDMIEP